MKVGEQTNSVERVTGCFGLGQRNERGDTLVEWATSKNFKITNTQFQKKAGRRWTWRSPDGHTRNGINYIMTDKPSMVTDVTVINRINIGSDHRMVMGSITLRRKLLNKNTRTRVDTEMIGTMKNTFQLELKNRFTSLEEHDDMDSLNKNLTEMIQQSAILFFLWFPLCRGEAGLFVTPMYGYFCNSFPLVPVVGLFPPLFFLLCLSQVSLHTILPS